MPTIINHRFVLTAACSIGLVCGTAQSNPPHEPVHAPKPAAAPAKAPAKTNTAKPEPKPVEPPAAKTPAKEKDAAPGTEKPAKSAKEAPAAAAAPEPAPTADEALRWLVDGNTRWANGKPQNPHNESARRESLADNGQKPFASILTCSDSRLPAERVFDAGVGDIFVVRVAGNVAGVSEAGTLEYGIEHLKTPLLVILGHTKCGAVAAAAGKAEVGGNIAALVDHIKPAVERAQKANPALEPKDLAAASVKENVWQSVFDLLRSSSSVRHMVKSGELKIVGGVYDLSSGKVEWLGEHPWQSELVSAFDARDARRAKADETKSDPKSTEQASHDEKPGH